MTYNEVNAILTEKDPETIAKYAELVPLFERMHELFVILNKRRRRRGSIDFDLKEPEIVLDDAGMVEAIIALERNVAHRLIEEFMLVANETVAQHLDDNGVPSLFRIHEDPDPLKVAEFEEFVATLGYSLAAPADGVKPRHFQKLVEKCAGRRRRSRLRPDAPHHAEGALRPAERRPLRPRGEELHALHLADSPLPDLVVHRTLREARHGLMTEPRREDSRKTCRRWRAIPPSGSAAPPMPSGSWCSGRKSASWRTRSRRVRRLYHRVTAFGLFIELVELSSRGWCILDHGDDYYSSRAAHILRARTPARSIASATSLGAGRQGGHERGRSIWAGRDPRSGESVRAQPRPAAEQRRTAAAPSRRPGVHPELGPGPDQKREPKKATTRKLRPAGESVRPGKASDRRHAQRARTRVRLDDAFLDRMRQTVDPPADAVAATLVAQKAHAVADLIKNRNVGR